MQFINAAIAASILGLTSAVPTKHYKDKTWTDVFPSFVVSFDILNSWTATPGEIFRAPGADFSTLLNFPLNTDNEGDGFTCELIFTPSVKPAASAQFQLFYSSQAHTLDDTSNFRDQFINTYAFGADGVSYVVDGSPTFACRNGTTLGFELAAVGDNEAIEVKTKDILIHLVYK